MIRRGVGSEISDSYLGERRIMGDKYVGSKQYLLIYAELIAAARYRGTVTYQELADLVGLHLTGAYMASELGGYLGAISEEETKQGRPMLSAITVTNMGRPGEGFFGKAKELGKLTSDLPDDWHAFWEAEKKAVYETWRKSLHKS